MGVGWGGDGAGDVLGWDVRGREGGGVMGWDGVGWGGEAACGHFSGRVDDVRRKGCKGRSGGCVNALAVE